MRRRWGRAAVVAATAGAALGGLGCVGAARDLMAIERTGPGTGGATERIVITGDGRGRCGAAGPSRPLASETVIEARALERALEPLAERAAAYPGPAGGRDRLVARTRAGTVRWVGARPGVPRVLARIELLAVRARRALCPRGAPPRARG